MSTIKIGSDQRDLREADPQWITQEVVGRLRDGQSVCVFVDISEPGINLSLCTPACRVGNGGGGRGRTPNPRESAIFKLWETRGLNTGELDPGQVVAFVKQLLHLL